MNISQHTILPLSWKMGQCRPDGYVAFITEFSLTQFFPFILPSGRVFPIPLNWRDLYGLMYLNPGVSGHPLFNNEFSSNTPFSIYDTINPSVPSKFISLILY